MGRDSRGGELPADLQSGGAGDDLDELLGDDSLSGAVEGEGQLVDHLSWRRERRNEASVKELRTFSGTFCSPSSCRLTGVLAGAVHGRHPGALLAGGRLPQGQVDDVDQSKLLVVPQHVGIDVIVDAHVLCTHRHTNSSRFSL